MNNTTFEARAEDLKLALVSNTRLVSALVVDDSPIDQRRLKSLCDKADLALDFDEANSLSEMRQALRTKMYDIIFIDYRLEDGDGLSALNAIKSDQKNQGAATIMIAGVAQTTIAVTALKSGCDDYILKDALDPHWLKRAVTNALEKSRLKRDFSESELLRNTLSKVLIEFSKSCTVEMKPILSRMLRQVRDLRGPMAAAAAAGIGTGKTDIHDLETCCSELWNYIEGFERSAVDACEMQFPKG